MIIRKFMLSRYHTPRKLIFYLTSHTSSFKADYSYVFARTLSSIPNDKSINETKKVQSTDKTNRPKNKINYAAMNTHGGLSNGAFTLHHSRYDPQIVDINELHTNYSSLAKARLSSLVVASACVGYVMAPAPLVMSQVIFCLVGTALSSSAANTFNQIIEVPYDSQMSRTKNRVLVRGCLTPLHATTFASVCTLLGISSLYFGVNPLVAALGAANIILYSFIYTPLKRYSIINTWIGSIVGAVPPLMGWAACTGSLDANAFILAAILYAWQFPHFNALSWSLKPDYSRAGYRMACIVNPDLCRRVALRYSLLMIPICAASCHLNLTSWAFLVETLPVNLYLIYLSFNFYRKADSKTSRSLFMFSLCHLPLVMILMISCKKYSEFVNKKLVL